MIGETVPAKTDAPPLPAFVIGNPAAGRGRGRRRIERFREVLKRHLPDFDYVETRGPGDEVALTDRALTEGRRTIVALGGDGTWSVVADRIVRSGRRDVTLGLLASGTGCDFGKSLGITYDRTEEVVRAIAGGRRRTIDVGRADGRHFLNVVGFGFDIAVIEDAAGFPILKGDALYRFCAIRQLFRFPGIPLRISGSDGPETAHDHLMLVIANANFFGGSFHIAPRADLEDGKLDAVSILNAGPLERMRLFHRVAKGSHEKEASVRIRRAEKFRIAFAGKVRYEVDGEVVTSGESAVEVETVPKALSIFAPGGDAAPAG